MRRVAPIVASVIAPLLLGCSSAPSPDGIPPPDGASGSAARAAEPVVLPASALPRMTSDLEPVDVETLTIEVAHPDELAATLDRAGFSSGSQRSFGGGTGAFSRVLARGLEFETIGGAAAFLSWFDHNAAEEIIPARRISPEGVTSGTVVFRHEPDGCCRNDVPVFLAAWQRGSSVLYLHVGGRKANTRAFVQLIESYDREA